MFQLSTCESPMMIDVSSGKGFFCLLWTEDSLSLLHSSFAEIHPKFPSSYLIMIFQSELLKTFLISTGKMSSEILFGLERLMVMIILFYAIIVEK